IFDDPDEYDIRILINAGYTDISVQQRMIQLCEDRRDCIPILDVPVEYQTAAKFVRYRRNLLNANTSFGTLYGPDILEVTDEGQKIYVPCSGAVAAVYAQSDAMADEWFAPAGVQRGVIDEIEGTRYKYDQGERNMLDQNQCNFIHKVSGYGYCVWGASTLQSAKSALQDVPVRRLINRVERTAKESALIGVYEPNDEILWQQLYDIVDRILRPVKNKRGLYDYSVKCDAEINTPDTIASGDVILVYIIQPTRYAKRILFTTSLAATGQLSTAVSFIEATS